MKTTIFTTSVVLFCLYNSSKILIQKKTVAAVPVRKLLPDVSHIEKLPTANSYLTDFQNYSTAFFSLIQKKLQRVG